MLENLTSTGNGQADLVNTLQAPAANYPLLWTLLVLVPLFFLITGRTFFKQKAREGRGNLLSSLAVGSFTTIMVSVAMRFIELIDRNTLAWVIGVGAIFIITYFLTDSN